MTSETARPLAANLRRLRAERGLTVVALARESGVGRATLTQLEAGSGNPTLETLYALANVLAAPLADLIGEPPPSGEPRVVRAGEGVPAASGRAVDARLLHRRRTASLTLEVYALTIRPGETGRSDPHPPGTREHLHVHDGAARVGPTDRPLELGAGDYADYPADVAHSYAATGDGPVAATLVIVTPAG